jgi:hypothetical protein
MTSFARQVFGDECSGRRRFAWALLGSAAVSLAFAAGAWIGGI